MNAPVSHPVEGAPPISVAALFHLMELGIIDPEARFELVEGEIVRRAPHGSLHQSLQRWLHKKLTIALSDRFWVAPGSTLILPEYTALDPDICVYPLDVETKDLSGEKVSLLVEIAHASRSYDLGRKAALYARMGAPELWVVDAAAKVTHVHRGPGEGVWSEVRIVRADEDFSPLIAPVVKLRISESGV